MVLADALHAGPRRVYTPGHHYYTSIYIFVSLLLVTSTNWHRNGWIVRTHNTASVVLALLCYVSFQLEMVFTRKSWNIGKECKKVTLGILRDLVEEGCRNKLVIAPESCGKFGRVIHYLTTLKLTPTSIKGL